MASLIGYYTTRFGELWEQSLFDLVNEAIAGVLVDARIEKKRIDAIFFANMMAGVLENNLHSTAKIAEIVRTNIPIFRVEAACASGGTAFHLAKQYVDANAGKTVLVVGAEKMTDYAPEETTSALASAASGEEQEAGLTFPGLYAMLAQVYFKKYSSNEKDLAYVSYKNHFHGTLNTKAHFRRKITVEQILTSPYIAFPLKVLDSSPISDGAAAVILSSDETLIKKTKRPVSIAASEIATDTISLKERKRLDGLLATTIAAHKAFTAAKIGRSDIGVAEVHDCFSIAEVLAMEDLGFWKKGRGGKKMRELSTMYGSNSSLIVNTSGGLKASGHPVGATGIKQIGEIYLQLTNQAESRQVRNVRYGLAHNVGGSGGTVVVTILGN